MDSIKIDNGLKTETGRYKPIEGDECSATELESAFEKLTDRVKAATSENPILVQWNKRTGTYEVMDNSFVPDDAPIIGSRDPKTIILMQWAEEARATERMKGFEDWLMEQDLFKNSGE